MNTNKKDLKKFGISIACFFILLSFVCIYKQNFYGFKIFLLLSVLIFFISTVIPYALLPFYFIILKITKIIGWINTRIILGLIFYFVFMPAGITLKIFKKDLLDLKKDSDSLTYWKKENKKINCNDFEKQY